jgi:DNA-3-methyladenine glycosylase II
MSPEVYMTKYQQALAHFAEADPILYKVGQMIELADLLPSQDHFRYLCGTIISQQLSTKVADTIETRFFQLFKNGVATVDQLLELSDESVRSIGVSNSKVKYLKNIAQAIKDGQLQLERIHSLSNEEVTEQLVKIKGIGPWTAEMFLMSSLARPDIFSAGDLGLRRAIQRLYGLNAEPTPIQLNELSQKWSPYRTYACKILWKSLDSKV